MANDKDTPSHYKQKAWETAAIWAIPGMVIQMIFNALYRGGLHASGLVIDSVILFVVFMLINRGCVAVYRKFSLRPDREWIAMMPLLLFLLAGLITLPYR